MVCRYCLIPSRLTLCRSFDYSQSACGPSAPFRPASSLIRHGGAGRGGRLYPASDGVGERPAMSSCVLRRRGLPPARSSCPVAVLCLASLRSSDTGDVTRTVSSITRRSALLSARSIRGGGAWDGGIIPSAAFAASRACGLSLRSSDKEGRGDDIPGAIHLRAMSMAASGVPYQGVFYSYRCRSRSSAPFRPALRSFDTGGGAGLVVVPRPVVYPLVAVVDGVSNGDGVSVDGVGGSCDGEAVVFGG